MNRRPQFARYRRRRYWRLMIIALPLLVLLAGGGYIYLNAQSILGAFSEGEKAKLVESAKQELGSEPKRRLPGLREGTTFLLVGSDTRAYEGNVWGRSDTILVVKIFPKERALSMLSIPRDTRVNIPGWGEDKINHSYSYGGPELLIATVRDFIGAPIDHYFQIGFEGFAELIDGFNGVYLPIDQRYYNKNDGSTYDYAEIDLRPGYQLLGAEDALSWVRFRHLDGDSYRAARQQIFLREVSRQLRERAGGDLGELRDLAQTIARAGASDFSSLTEAARLANTLRNIPADRVVRTTIQGQDALIDGIYYLQVSEEERSAALDLWNNPESVLIGQKKSRAKTTATGAAFLATLRALQRPVAGLRPLGPLGSWRGPENLSGDIIRDVRNMLLRASARKTKKQEKTSSSEESAELISNPAAPMLLGGTPVCTPQKLPAGYSWPADSSYRYRLAGRPALARYATAGSGISILWMWSSWIQAPILVSPDDRVMINNKLYSIWWESGKVRMVAWNDRSGNIAWITNTLQNALSEKEMLSLATSCR